MKLPKNISTLILFLTMRCNARCEYCIQKFSFNKNKSNTAPKYNELNGQTWIDVLIKYKEKTKRTILMEGGEPTLHKDFKEICTELSSHYNLNILTNLVSPFYNDLDMILETFVPLNDSIFWDTTYHVSEDFNKFIHNYEYLKKGGLNIKINGIVSYPGTNMEVIKNKLKNHNLKPSIRNFMGFYNGELYPKKVLGYKKYTTACNSKRKKVICTPPNKCLIAPDGAIYNCHHLLYLNEKPLGNILKDKIEDIDIRKPFECSYYGNCNPCDYGRFKVKLL